MKRILLGILAGLPALIAFLFFFLSSSPAYALDENKCLLCHSKPSLTILNPSGASVSLYVDQQVMDSSAHKYIDCTQCHGLTPHSVASPLTKLSLAEKCGTCHRYEYEQHLKSIHGEQLLIGNPEVATCVDCHSSNRTPHGIIRVLDYAAPAYPKNISQTCARCHGDEKLMARYGIVEKVYESYMRSFHGKAIQLGSFHLEQLNKATCTNCHGTHDIKRVDNPNSPVAGVESLAKTCEQCHPGAGVEFASGFLGHQEARPETNPVVYYAERFFMVLTGTVIALGIILVAAEMRIGLFGGRKRPPEEPQDPSETKGEG